MELFNSDLTLEVDESDKEAVQRIKNWVMMICRKKCNDSNKIYVSPVRYKNQQGELRNKTVVCVSANLPEGPVIQIPKAMNEVCLEDLLGCYSLINYCK